MFIRRAPPQSTTDADEPNMRSAAHRPTGATSAMQHKRVHNPVEHHREIISSVDYNAFDMSRENTMSD